MVQREVADRFFAEPSTKAYGAVSVLVQLAARRTGFHPVARTVFRPPPNVDSALVAFRRIALPAALRRDQEVVEASFAHRRKTLPNSLALAGLAAARTGRRRARGDRARRPRPAPRRSSRPSSSRSPRRCDASAGRRAKINLALVVGPARDDGKHEVGDGAAARRSRRPDHDRSRRHARRRPASPATRSSTARSTRARRRRRRRAALARDDQEADPGRGRARRRQLRRGDGAPARERDARPAARAATSCGRSRRTIGADVPFFLADGPQLGRGDGTELAPLELPQDYWVVLALPHGAVKLSTADVYRRFDERMGADGFEERRARARADARGRPPPARSRRAAARTTSRRRRSPPSCSRPGAFRADVSGAGPAVYGLFHHRRHADAAAAALRGVARTWLTVPAWYG